jgi:hypothetical protein
MIRLSKSAKFVLCAVAAACCAPATSDAQAQKHMGFECVPDVLLTGANGIPIKNGDQFVYAVTSADECLGLCNKTKDCIAVSIVVGPPGKPFGCFLFSKVITMQKYDTRSYGWTALTTCVKAYPTKTLDGPPQTYQEVPNIPRPDQYRPGPQPGPQPGGRR